MTVSKWLALTALIVVALSAALIGVASGHTKKWSTFTTAQLSEGSHLTVIGRISSPKARCERHRTVEIASGDGTDTLDVAYSKADGSWSTSFLDPGPGPVRVEVGKEFFPFRPGHRHICKKYATSVTIPAPPPDTGD